MVSRRRGFAIAMVMMVFTVAAMLMAAALYRANARTQTVSRQIQQYQAHHDAEGLRTVTLRWLRTTEAQREIRRMADTGEPVFSVQLATGATVTLRVYNGQGTLLADPMSAREGPQRERLIEALEYLAPESRTLLRSIGPVKVGILAAPDEVLEAIALGDEQMFALLAGIRSNPPDGDNDIALMLSEMGIDSAVDRAPIIQMVTLATSLWEIEAEVERDGFAPERYQVTAELQGNLPYVHRVRRIDLPEDREGMAR